MKNPFLLFGSFLFVLITLHPAKAQNHHLKEVYEKNVIRPHLDYFMRGDETLSRKQVYLHLGNFEESTYEYRLHKKAFKNRQDFNLACGGLIYCWACKRSKS